MWGFAMTSGTAIDSPRDGPSVRGDLRLVAMGILAVALALRLYLVAHGGAFFWTDEKRFNASREAVASLAEGDVRGAAYFLLSKSDHIGFRWLALVPATVERLTFGSAPPHARIAAGFFALFGVANLFLVWRIAQRLAQDDWEPVLALAFAASSNALFFFSRHCFPYDAALTCFLWAALVSLGSGHRRQSVWVGLLCGLGYLIYNGYWSVGAVILVLDVIWRRESFAARASRALAGLAGLLAPIAAVAGVAWLLGFNLVRDALAFSGSVNQGDFGGGRKLIFDYLLIADGALPVGLAAMALVGLVVMVRRRRPTPWLRWVAASLLLFAVWIFFSDVVHQFVLYGRTVRAAVPFLALAAAGAAGSLLRPASPGVRLAILAGGATLCVAGATQMIAPLRQMFPVEFRARADIVKAEALRRDPTLVFQTQFADYLYDYEFPEEPPPHRELLREPHPQHYLPYLYEGYTAEQRPRYMAHDTAMRLIQLETDRGLHLLKKSPGSRWLAPFPGPLSLRLRLPLNHDGRMESLLLHGNRPELSDRLTLHYVDARHVQIGLQHGYDKPRLSEPMLCDYSTEHTIVVSLASFYPPAGDPRFAATTGFEALSRRHVVQFDGQTVFALNAVAEGAQVSALRIGAGIPADGTNPGAFSGEILSVRQVDPRTMADADWLPAVSRSRCFPDAHGPIELKVRFPSNASGRSQALVSSGQSGAGDLLLVTYLDDRHLRFTLDHWGGAAVQSPPVEFEPEVEHRILISMGSLFPAAGHRTYSELPELNRWRERIMIKFDDRTVISQRATFHPTPPTTVTFGRCTTGATTAEPIFTGEITGNRSVAPTEIDAMSGRPPPVTGPSFADYHGTIEMNLRFPDDALGSAEPLLASGRPGAGDLLYVHYVDERHVVFALDHWGSAALRSPPIEIDRGTSHRLTASLGSLFPPQTDTRYHLVPQVRLLQHWIVVRLDGQTIFSQRFHFFPAEPDAVSFGVALPGNTATGPVFTGRIESLRRVPPETIGFDEQHLRGPALQGARYPTGHPGPLALTVQLPAAWDPGIEPLLLTGDEPNSEAVLVKYRGSQQIQLGYRSGSGPVLWSTPLPSSPGATHTLKLSLGSLHPETGVDERWRKTVRIDVDGRTVIDVSAPPFRPLPESLVLGANPAGIRGVRPDFRGRILDARCGPHP